MKHKFKVWDKGLKGKDNLTFSIDDPGLTIEEWKAQYEQKLEPFCTGSICGWDYKKQKCKFNIACCHHSKDIKPLVVWSKLHGEE